MDNSISSVVSEILIEKQILLYIAATLQEGALLGFDFFHERYILRGWRYSPPKQLLTFPGHTRRKENHVGPAVSEILSYRQTNILLFLYKDM